MNHSLHPQLFRAALGDVQMQVCFAAVPNYKTFIAKQKVTYPYHVGRCLQFPDDPAGMTNVYIQSCSGGLFEADHWTSEVAVESGASVHLTTSASTVVHRADQHAAKQKQIFSVEKAGYLEYIPMSTILFPQSRLQNMLQFHLQKGALVCVFDSFQASTLADNSACFTSYESELNFDQDQKTILKEKFAIIGEMLKQPTWGFNAQYQCFGNFYMVGDIKAPQAFVEKLQTLKVTDAYVGANYLAHHQAIVVRLMSESAVALNKLKFEVLSAWREHQFGRPLLRHRK